jgi:hypothetical protein
MVVLVIFISSQTASQQGAEEDFSWDDEADTESTPPSATAEKPASPEKASAPTTSAATDALTPKPAAAEKLPSQPAVTNLSKSNNSTSTSPRDSEESYDLVSDQKKSAAQTDDDDSDWE